MAGPFKAGWTAASLLPSVAAGFSPGAAWSGVAPVQVNGNPVSQKIVLEQSKAKTRKTIASKVLGIPRNPAVNAASTRGYGIR